MNRRWWLRCQKKLRGNVVNDVGDEGTIYIIASQLNVGWCIAPQLINQFSLPPPTLLVTRFLSLNRCRLGTFEYCGLTLDSIYSSKTINFLRNSEGCRRPMTSRLNTSALFSKYLRPTSPINDSYTSLNVIASTCSAYYDADFGYAPPSVPFKCIKFF